MSEKRFNGKAIYNPSGKAGEYSYWACNFYTGCSNGCDYCYCRRGVMSHVWSDKPQLKKCFKDEDDAIAIFKKELLKNMDDIRENGIFFTFTSDPILADTFKMTAKALNICMEYDIPVKLLTKGHITPFTLFNWIHLDNQKGGKYKKMIAVGFTLTGHDDMEPNASPNKQRIEDMRMLHNDGFKTFASIEPIIDFASSLDMIEKTIECCDLYKVGLMSGKKYNVIDAQTFVEKLIELPGEPKIYLKESLQKLTGYNIGELLSNFVNRDYNIFK